MTDIAGAHPPGAAENLLAAAEREAEHLREVERDARRQAEILKRNAHRLASATTPAEVAETTIVEVKALGLTVAELTTSGDPGSPALVVLASFGLSPAAVARIHAATADDEFPAAVAMRTDAHVAIRPAASSRAYPPAAGDPEALPLAQILAWPLHDADGSVLGALSVGLTEELPRSGAVQQILLALAEQTGLALGRALEADRRREVERELGERHRMVTELTALVPGLLYVFDLARGQTLFVNRQAAEILGYSGGATSDLATDDVFRLIHPDDVAPLREHMAALGRLADGEALQVQYRLRHSDGSWRWFQGRDSVLRRDAAGEVTEVIGVASDVTEEKRALDALAEREGRYRSLFSSIDEGYCLCEIVTGEDGAPIDYRFLEVNPSFEEKTGIRDPVGHTARELVPDLEDHWVVTMGRVPLGGETVRYENRAEGLQRWFDIYAAPAEPVGRGRFVVVVNDVTERHRAEEALRETAEAARRGRARSELVTAVMRELEAIDRLRPLADRLVDTLVPRLADYALLEIPGRSEPVIALSHTDPAKGEVLRALRDGHLFMSDANSIVRAAAGEPRLLDAVSHGLLRELSAGSDEVLGLLEQLGPLSHIAVPVDVSGESGALLLGLSDPERPPYGAEELALAQDIAHRVSVLFAHARVREDEHTIGIRLQQALLPEGLLTHPAAQVAARYQTGSDLLYVGGDWYDTLALPDGRIALVVGDVVGHGLDAAASMSRMRIALAALAPDAPTPGVLLSRLEEFAAGANGVRFATATCSYLDPATGELSYASAGHPPGLIVAPDGASRWLDGGRSTPVGSSSLIAERPSASDQLADGELLILYSDGLVERRREAISTGLTRLEDAARVAVDMPIDELCAQLMDQLTRTSTNDDDAVILCLRFSPVTSSSFRRRIPADPRELAPTRRAIRTWLEAREAPSTLVQRLLLAVGEALTNAIEHGYYGRSPGAIELSIAAGEDALEVVVRDHGRWREAASQVGRGNGFQIIRALAGKLERNSDETGTRVAFAVPVSEGGEG